MRTSWAPISDEVKALVINKVVHSEMTQVEAAHTYNISTSSVEHIIQAAQCEEWEQVIALGEEAPPWPMKHRCGRKPKLNIEDIALILDWVEETPWLTLKEIIMQLQEQCSVKVTKSTVKCAFESVNFSYKDLVNILAQWNTDEVKLKRQDFVINQVQEHMGRTLVFLDKMPANLHVCVKQGHAPQGHLAQLTTLPKGNNITLIAMLTKTSILFHKFVHSREKGKHSTTTDNFHLFLLNLKPLCPPNTLLILDNTKIHHTNTIHNTLNVLQSHSIDHLFLPPYSPFLNPIKYVFLKIKSVIRHASFSNHSDLQVVIKQGLAAVTPQDMAHWCGHVTRYFHQCTLALPFHGHPLAPELFTNLPAPSPQLQSEWSLFAGQHTQQQLLVPGQLLLSS